jgi:hypothetical protein
VQARVDRLEVIEIDGLTSDVPTNGKASPKTNPVSQAGACTSLVACSLVDVMRDASVNGDSAHDGERKEAAGEFEVGQVRCSAKKPT